MTRSRSRVCGRANRNPAPSGRMIALVLLVAAAAACCPAPLAPASFTPTAFAAVVAEVEATSWVAEGPGGARYSVAGEAPAALGARVYLSGVLADDGSLVVEQADPLTIR